MRVQPKEWIRRIEEQDDRIIGVIEQLDDDERESFFTPIHDQDTVQVVKKTAKFYARRGHKVDF